MKLEQLVKDLDYKLIRGTLDTQVDTIQNDSRMVKENALFFCIAGAQFDGHSYADEVVQKGVSVLVVEKPVEVSTKPDVTIIQVASTRYAMGMISAAFYGHPSDKLTVIGITGTKGKTTTTYMLHSMLEQAGHKCGLIGTIETIIGKNRMPANNTTPESIVLQKVLADMVREGLDCVVMEVSSQGLMLDRVAGVSFDYGIFTNLSEDHIGPNEHKDFEEYLGWKAKLFTLCKTGIFNLDDTYCGNIMEGSTCRVITYGLKDSCDYQAIQPDLFKKNGCLGIRYRLEGVCQAEVVVGMPGEFSVHNSLAAIAVARQMQVPMETILDILTSVSVKGRVELIPISNAFTLLIDYAHNAMSLESILKTLRAYQPKRLIALFGCGGNRSKVRRYEMGEVAGNVADLTIITSDNPRNEEPQAIIEDIKIGMNRTKGKYMEIISRKEAIRYAIMHAKEGDVIVLAGKGHEDYQEIQGKKYHMDERDLIREILEEEDVTKICGYHN